MYQKTTRNIKKYKFDLKYYDNKENEKYIKYKKVLKQ